MDFKISNVVVIHYGMQVEQGKPVDRELKGLNCRRKRNIL
jgi:hypothetical protein